MKLTELFPELPILKLGGKEYELKHTTRSMIQLERDYPDITVDGKEKLTQERIITAINSIFTGMKHTDAANFLYAQLLHTNEFNNKEKLIDVMETNQFNTYIDNIFCAYKLSTLTPEQIEKMEVMAKINGAKKKPEVEITQVNMPSLESKLD